MSVLSQAMPPQRTITPVDQDLQNLYDEVWAGFAVESPTTDGDLDNIYNDYGGESDYAATPTTNASISTQDGPVPSTRGGFSSSSHPPSKPTPQSKDRHRPLPPTPSTSSTTSSPVAPFAMPEPEPYYDPNISSSRPSHSSNDSYTSSSNSADLLKKATTSNSGNRQLQTPASTNGSRTRRSGMYGLPAGVRPPSHQVIHSSESNVDGPSSMTQPHADRISPSRSAANGSGGSHSPKEPSNHLPGAFAPGFKYGSVEKPKGLPSRSFEIYNKSSGDFDDYQSRPSGSNLYNNSIPKASDTSAIPTSVNRRSSREHVRNFSEQRPSRAGFNASRDAIPYGSYPDSLPGRSASGSSISRDGFVNRYREPARNYDTYPGRSSSLAARSMDRGDSTGSQGSQTGSDQLVSFSGPSASTAGPSNTNRQPPDVFDSIANYRETGVWDLYDDDDEYWDEDESEVNESSFIDFSLLSHIAVQLRDKVPRGTHVKGSIPYPRAFTGKDIVSTIQSQIQRELGATHGISPNDRRAALQVARSLQSQLFFYEVEWGGRVLQDGVEDVYMFLDDQEGGPDTRTEREELPTGVITMLTKCYSVYCSEEAPCYSYACPRKGNSIVGPMSGPTDVPARTVREAWSKTVEREVLESLPESEINRQTIIHKLISKEEQYIQDLDIVESVFIEPLRTANPPIIPPDRLDNFIEDVFCNILDLRECNRRLLEVMCVRQREQAPVIQRIGDVFLDAATEFRSAYPIYVGHHPLAEKRMKEETESNPEFRLFVEDASRQSARPGDSLRLDLRLFLNRPSEHLQKYPVLLEAILNETAVGNPDADYLVAAIKAIKNLQTVAQVRTFQWAMGKGLAGKWEWHDLVSPEVRKTLGKDEGKRQFIIFELIKGEMAYVKDLENIETMYIEPLRNADPPIIPPERLDQFIQDVFHNYSELHIHHRKLMEKFHDIQGEEHPKIRTITPTLYDAALNFREAYMEYIPNYPIAAYRIDEEMANNPAFKAFVEQCIRHPDAHRLDMQNFINRPIPRLLRYELLLKGILDETPQGHEDRETIPHVLDLIKALGKEVEPGVVSAKAKVDLWRYNSMLVFKPGDVVDMDLLDENRSLIHAGKLLRHPESGLNGWSELFIILFDNYLVMTKPKEKDGVLKYFVNRRPIPLDLLTLSNFTDPPTQRSAGLLRFRSERHADGSGASIVGASSPESAVDSRTVYPCALQHSGRLGGPLVLYAESAQARTEWKQKLEEALGLRKVVQESNKVFEVETLSTDTFLVPSMAANTASPPPAWNPENTFTGRVTCSVPFDTADGRGLVAIGCAEGVWIGFRHDPRSMRRVLHLKMVTQCAMLEDFGIFLVLADKSLFAYHIEALVPSSPQNPHTSQTPQKLNGTKDVHFFSVGSLHGRTLVIYMKKKQLDSVFRVLEPVIDKINERTKAPVGLSSRLGFRSARSEWFRIYRDFFLPSESFDLLFLKAKIAILCTKGFEIMDLTNFKSVTIPQRDDPKLEKLARRCESCRPLGMFRSAEDEFLLCYDEFGFYVDKRGDPCREPGTIIEWEGVAERVALHSPYIMLFDNRFIEIRHIETGRLAQIIPGTDVRCLWDGRGVHTNVTPAPAQGGIDDDMVQEARVHAVMNADPTVPPGSRPLRAVAQHVFELIPTIPLYLPGSLASPSNSTHFPQSTSPPRSPPLQLSSSRRSS